MHLSLETPQYHLPNLEKNDHFNVSDLINDIIEKYNNENITTNLSSKIYINGRKNLIKRCINNLIDNENMKINILLPYKEKFDENKASSVSITVRNNLLHSNYLNQIKIFGQNDYNI